MQRGKLLVGALLALGIAASVRAQQPTPAGPAPPSLAALRAEAEAHNPEIAAARHAWQAAAQVPSQQASWPDPEVSLQHLSVGSPRPFAGWTNSDFAYVAFGVTQRIPLPAKLAARRAVAEAEVAAQRQRYEAVRRDVFRRLAQAYIAAAGVQERLRLLAVQQQLAGQLVQAAQARYRAGQGTQQEILQAQLEQTQLLATEEELRLDFSRKQAELRYLLGRSQQGPDIPVAPLQSTSVRFDFTELRQRLSGQNPEVRVAIEEEDRANRAVELARKDFYPDFSVSYQWQHTAARFRDMYMLTFGVEIPLHRRGRLLPALRQAEQERLKAEADYRIQLGQAEQQLRQSYDTLQRTEALLRLLQQGLLPQAEAAVRAALTAYAAGQADFASVLKAFQALVGYQTQQVDDLAEHETAVAQIEQLTGLDLIGNVPSGQQEGVRP